MEVMIIGAGIGGLTAALALDQLGIGVRVFESVHEPRPLGVGINLLPHSVRVLDSLGVLERLEAISIRTQDLVFFNRLGQQIWREPRGLEAGYKWPQLAVHRGQLQMLLMEIARERLGDRVVTGHHLADFEQDDAGVTARFENRRGASTLPDARGAVLVGADGIHSAVRAHLFPHEGPPKWNGAIQYRGTCDDVAFLSGRSQFQAGGRQTFLAYPILFEGRRIINWVARYYAAPSGSELRREDWNRRGELSQVLPHYTSWRFDWLDIPTMMQATDAIYEFPMVDRDPLDRWTFGGVTLMGDAAHPMYPLGSNGAGQAILDAQGLAKALAECAGDARAGLRRYEGERRPMSSEVVLAARRGGPESVIRLVEERAPEGFDDLSSVITHEEMAGISENYKRTSGFDLASVNRSAP
jgi:2-polyprenyl-6-methoxyphenol hydroxylase-like FAD-dependent oxidoreductase